MTCKLRIRSVPGLITRFHGNKLIHPWPSQTKQAPLASAMGAALLASVYSNYRGRFHYKCYAESQLRYALSRFTVGFGPGFPRQPAHRGASCPGGLATPCTRFGGGPSQLGFGSLGFWSGFGFQG